MVAPVAPFFVFLVTAAVVAASVAVLVFVAAVTVFVVGISLYRVYQKKVYSWKILAKLTSA